jgi:ankyrin repeat protein
MFTRNTRLIVLSALFSLGLTAVVAQAYSPNHTNDSLYNAVNKGDYTRVSTLLNQGANPNSNVSEGSLLHIAVLKNDVENVRVLLERGANPNIANGKGITPLYDAVARDQVAIVQLLLNHGANPNIESRNVSPLHKAIERDRVAMVQLLLERGANPNVRDSYGLTPLQYAQKHNQASIQKLLMQYGGGNQAYTTPQPTNYPSRYHHGSSY